MIPPICIAKNRRVGRNDSEGDVTCDGKEEGTNDSSILGFDPLLGGLENRSSGGGIENRNEGTDGPLVCCIMNRAMPFTWRITQDSRPEHGIAAYGRRKY